MHEIALVITTVADNENGRSLVKNLLDRKIIACGHVMPSGNSLYNWNGKLCDEEECTVVLKTSVWLGQMIRQEVQKLHKYEIPEVLLMKAESTPEYAAWVESEVSKN